MAVVKTKCAGPNYVEATTDVTGRIEFSAAGRDVFSSFVNVLFHAPLKTSLMPAFSQIASAIVSMTRASVATVTDHAGRVRYVRSGEARFHGARRTANILADSEGFTTGWTLGANTALTPNTTGGGLVSYSGSLSVNVLTVNSAAYEPGRHTFSIFLWGASSTNLKMRIERSSDGALVAEKTIDATSGSRKRYAIHGVISDTTNHRIVLTNTVVGAFSVNVACAQLEQTDGTDGAPGDYLARGIVGAVAPFLGAGVEGVRYDDYENNWSIDAAGVATKSANVTQIDESKLLGLIHENTAIQRLLYSSALDNAVWAASGATAAQSVGTDNPIGYGRIYLVTDKLSQSWSGTVPAASGSLLLASSIYAKPGTANWLRIGFIGLDGATTAQAWIDLASGTIGTLQNVNAKDVHLHATGVNGMYRAGVSALGGASGSTLPRFFFAAAASDGSETLAGLTVLAGGAQFEANDHVTSYIGNSAAGLVTRNSDAITVPTTLLPASRNDFTIGFGYAPFFDFSSPSKRDFYYICAEKFNWSNRFGITHRPGLIGGGADSRADDFAQDYYPGTGTEFGGVATTGTTTDAPPIEYGVSSPIFFGLSSVPQQPNGDGSFATVAGVAGIPTVGATPMLSPVAILGPYIEFGGDGAGTGAGGYQSCAFKNMTIFGNVVPAESRVVGNLAPPAL